jgi:hypothetical protein
MKQIKMGIVLGVVLALGLGASGCGKKKEGGGGGGLNTTEFKRTGDVMYAMQKLLQACGACTDQKCAQQLALTQPDPLGEKARVIMEKASQAEQDQFTSLKGQYATCAMAIPK